MCLACEEQEYFFRVWCADFLARGEMPPGVTAEDLEAMGLPLPKPAVAGSDHAPAKASAPAATDLGFTRERNFESPSRQPPTWGTFACDSPDE
jgi:hypothetical protein